MLRRGLGYALAGVLVLLALGNGIGSQLLPLAERHPDRIAAWLQARVRQPVAFDRVETEWTRRGPLLRLDNLRIGRGDAPLRIGDAEILVAQYAGLLPWRSFTELRVRGLDLTLERDDSGRWQVRGLPGQQSQADPLATLERLGELQVSHARLHVRAPALGIETRLPRIDLRMQVAGKRVRAGVHAWFRTGDQPIAAAIDFDRGTGDGQVYAGLRDADLRAFAGLPRIAGVVPVAGRGRLQAWLDLHGHRIDGVRASATLEGVVLQGAPLVAGAPAPTRSLGAVSLDARWRGTLRQWQAQATRLRIGSGRTPDVLDGLAVAGGERYGLRAARLDAEPLLAVLALGDAASPRLRQWLAASSAGAVLEDVTVSGVRGGAMQARARVRGLHFAPVGNSPGMRGVSGDLVADASGMRLRFDPKADVVFDWPAGFGVVHTFTLDGEAVAWHDADGWTVQTPGLAIDGRDLKVDARGGIGFPAGGGRPRLDIAADIGEAPVKAAPGFWIHHLMPKATIAWLDAALQGGRLRDVHAVVAGDLRDWPFRDAPSAAGAGLFRIDARIEDGLLKFQRDWPAAEGVDAALRFQADGFTLAGAGRLAGVPIPVLKAGIPRFGHAELSVEARATGDAGAMLAMLRNSPLQREYGPTMDALRAKGAADAGFRMQLPLYHGAPPPQIDGTVALAGARLEETRWDLVFEGVQGNARFDRLGFVAEGLQVRYAGLPGALSLRAGPHVRDPKQAFEADLQATVGIDALLAKAGSSMDWLLPWVDGRSPWTVSLGIPRGAAQAAPPTQLRLRSSLVGTAIDLPEPLRKPATQALPATVDVTLPMERGEVAVNLGNLLSLRSRSNGRQTGVRARLGGGTVEPPPLHGLQVEGRVRRLEALDWIGVVSGQAGGDGLPLRRIEVQADALRLLGADFADATLVLAPAPRGTAVQVRGAGIEGSLLVPSADGAQVAGRFERFHWTLPGLGVAQAGTAAPVAGAREGFDPARIPPLLFDIADLRLGEAVLGNARFRSVPGGGGLRMEEFTTRGGKQRLRASGTWSGRAATARTQLRLDVDSDDVGALLGGLGLGGQLAGGKGKLGVEAGWRGGPDAFALAALDAQVAVDVKNGRLLQLEPGAGRVLGLLGIAQLPRRLTLDFRDFFDKGFAFDRIHGNVRIAQGEAGTDDLAILGPAADIHVRGSTDLRAQRFDQTVDVYPKSGGLLTAVGAIAGGPVGAAVGAVANAVLDKPMQGIGARRYRITGPWQSPKVETLERPPPAARTPKPAPPPA